MRLRKNLVPILLAVVIISAVVFLLVSLCMGRHATTGYIAHENFAIWSKTGQTLYYLSDFRSRLWALDTATGKQRCIGRGFPYDTSPDEKYGVTNYYKAYHRGADIAERWGLNLVDLKTGKEHCIYLGDVDDNRILPESLRWLDNDRIIFEEDIPPNNSASAVIVTKDGRVVTRIKGYNVGAVCNDGSGFIFYGANCCGFYDLITRKSRLLPPLKHVQFFLYLSRHQAVYYDTETSRHAGKLCTLDMHTMTVHQLEWGEIRDTMQLAASLNKYWVVHAGIGDRGNNDPDLYVRDVPPATVRILQQIEHRTP